MTDPADVAATAEPKPADPPEPSEAGEPVGDSSRAPASGGLSMEGFPRTLCASPAAPLPGEVARRRVGEWGVTVAVLALVVGGIVAWESYRRPPDCGSVEALDALRAFLSEHLPLLQDEWPGRVTPVAWQAEERRRICAMEAPTEHGPERVLYRVQWAPEGEREPRVEPHEMLPGCGAREVLELARARSEALDQAAGRAPMGVRHLVDARQVGWDAASGERLCQVTVSERGGDRTLAFTLSRLADHSGQFRLRGTFVETP